MKRVYVACLIGCLIGTSFGEGEPELQEESVVLEASKDTYGRRNKQNHNNGASDQLLIAPFPSMRALIAFDLSGVTNEIVGAEFRFHQKETTSKEITLVIAPMVHTTSNASWTEGVGDLGIIGSMVQPGESSYRYSTFKTTPWESTSGAALSGFDNSSLWLKPTATLKRIKWTAGTWTEVPITDIQFLETIRASEVKNVTFGIWGTSGYGYYYISSRESAQAPELHLTLKIEEE